MNDFTDNLMSWDTPLHSQLSPASSDCVYITATHTAVLDMQGNVVWAESLQGELFNGEVGVLFGVCKISHIPFVKRVAGAYQRYRNLFQL